jgi:hypothetical protein
MVQQHEHDDHLIVQRFFSLKGLIAERILETTSKTPDFRIRRDGEVVAFCEVKSPQDIFTERVNNAINAGKGGVVEIGYGNDYRQARCIERAAQKAVAQFQAMNSAHSVPNILTVVNHDQHADVEDFVQSLTGTLEGRAIAQGIQNTIPEIDLYVWIDQKNGRNRAKGADNS